jgi:hypothetical protein
MIATRPRTCDSMCFTTCISTEAGVRRQRQSRHTTFLNSDDETFTIHDCVTPQFSATFRRLNTVVMLGLACHTNQNSRIQRSRSKGTHRAQEQTARTSAIPVQPSVDFKKCYRSVAVADRRQHFSLLNVLLGYFADTLQDSYARLILCCSYPYASCSHSATHTCTACSDTSGYKLSVSSLGSFDYRSSCFSLQNPADEDLVLDLDTC